MSLDTVARRDDAVLIVVDEQERLVAAMDRREQVLATSARLVKVAALVGMPIVVTRQYPKGLGDTDPVLLEALRRAESAGASVSVVDKVAFDCFGDAGFVEALAHLERRQILIVGMETHICITQTSLAGVRQGFDVHVIADGCCSRDEANHAIALDRMRGAGVVVTVAESIMYELVGEAATDEFRELLKIVKE
jgi:nicotinamidase-related amidase